MPFHSQKTSFRAACYCCSCCYSCTIKSSVEKTTRLQFFTHQTDTALLENEELCRHTITLNIVHRAATHKIHCHFRTHLSLAIARCEKTREHCQLLRDQGGYMILLQTGVHHFDQMQSEIDFNSSYFRILRHLQSIKKWQVPKFRQLPES